MLDIIIIGSGPAGLSAAVYAKRAGWSVQVLEKEYEGTGQIAESGRVDNYLGFYGIGGYELGEHFRGHAVELGVEFVEGKACELLYQEQADAKQSHYVVRLEGGETLIGRTVIYCAGAGPRRASLKGEAQLVGKGVSYCAICDGAFYRDKTVAVLGGGDTALDDALYLSEVAKKVYLIHRREEFRGAGGTVMKLKDRENVEFLLKEQAVAILGEERVTGLLLESGKQLTLDGVFVAFGSIPNSDLVRPLVDLDEQGYVIAGEEGVTKLPGLFVAGDVRTKKLRQVTTAVADGANAVTSASEYLK